MATEKPGSAPACIACGSHMTYVRTIWRGVGPDLDVFRCRSCGLSLGWKAPDDAPPGKPGGAT